jgi:4-carboxymuconolactone decarboxylase
MRTKALLVVTATLLSALPAVAQDRMPPISPERLTEAQKKAREQFLSSRGVEVFGPFVPLLRSPQLMLSAQAMGDYLRFHSTLSPRIKEMVILIACREWTQQHEWRLHHPLALMAGLRREVVDAIADGRRPFGIDAEQEAAYDLATEILRNRRVSDPTWRRALAQFSESDVVDLLGLAGYYGFIATLLNATRPGLPAGGPELRRFPE